MNDRPAAEVDRRDRRRVADPPAQPLGLLVEDVRPDQQEERREAEHDEDGSWSSKVSAMFATQERRRRRSTALSGRRWPNTAYDANIEVAQTSSPKISR